MITTRGGEYNLTAHQSITIDRLTSSGRTDVWHLASMLRAQSVASRVVKLAEFCSLSADMPILPQVYVSEGAQSSRFKSVRGPGP